MEAELIPGLPDCVALQCLLRLPFQALCVSQGVCKRWRRELASPSFYRLRKAVGLSRNVVALLLRGNISTSVGKLHLVLLEPTAGLWTMQPLGANRPHAVSGYSQAAVVGWDLVVVGGWDKSALGPTGEVHIYDLLSGAWRPGAPIPPPLRTSYACAASARAGKVYVVGGLDAQKIKLRSALAYDVAGDVWSELPEISAQEQDTCQGTFEEQIWRSRGECDTAVRWCRRSLMNNEQERVHLLKIQVTADGWEQICMLREGQNWEALTLREALRRRLGLSPHEFPDYIESLCVFRL